MTQICFSGLRPPMPTIRTRCVAEAIARRIVEEVNLDDFYWEQSELPERITDVADEIARCGNPQSVFYRLYKKQPFVSDAEKERVTHPYGWEGIDEHCHHIAEEIASEELDKAQTQYTKDYGQP